MAEGAQDWRVEVNWPYVRRFVRAHLIMWIFGFVLFGLSGANLLVGPTRKFLGVLGLLLFAGSLIGVVPIFGKAMKEDSEGPVYSFQVFLVLIGFLISSGGYIWLLSTMSLDSIELW